MRVLEQTCRVQRRVRDLPARVVVYLLLAGCLFAELGYSQVWHRLTAGLGGLPAATPAASAMTQARPRLGPGPLRELFFLLRGQDPAGARWRGLLVCAIDGTIMSVADSTTNLAVYAKQRGGRNGDSSYPMLRLLVLLSCCTRTVIVAVFRPVSAGETTCAPLLLASLRTGMILHRGSRHRPGRKIGRTVLAGLIPARRLRISPRVVKRAMSRYNAGAKSTAPPTRPPSTSPSST